MQDLLCLVCASDKTIPIFEMRRDPYLRRLGLDGAIVKKVMCQVCGLVYSKPQLEEIEVKRLYGTLRGSDTPSEEHLWWKQRQAEEDFRWIAARLQSKGKVLDIGCSEGSFLMQFKRIGWETCGIEPSAFAQFGRQVYGLDIRQGTFEEVSLAPSTFDLVATLRVLEHVVDPHSFLSQVKGLIKPDGWLYLEVPNAWKPRHHPGEFLGAHHLRLFTRRSLLALLGRCGFAPITVDDQGRGIRVFAQSNVLNGDCGAFVEPLENASEEARALRRTILRYRVEYFWKTTMKTRARRGLDSVLGPERAKSLVAWGKRIWRKNHGLE